MKIEIDIPDEIIKTGNIANDCIKYFECCSPTLLETLRSAMPAQRTGKWIKTRIRISSGDFTRGVKCSKCGYKTIVDDFKYCPNCGNPKMEEGE